jgi:hypothetical protein
MRRLTQKELVQEGIGTFMKKAGKGAMSVAGSVLGGLARAASPTAAGLVDKTKGAISNTMSKAKAAMSTPEEKIADYFKDMGYKVMGTSPGVSDDIKVVKVSEVEYTDDGSVKEKEVSSPFVVKVDKSGIKVLRGPRQARSARPNNSNNKQGNARGKSKNA